MNDDIRQLLNSVNTAIIKIRGAYAAWSKQNNVNYHEMLIMYSLRDNVVCTQKQICEQYLLPKQTVNNVITSLRRSGYIVLIPIENNKREKAIVLTESGREYVHGFMMSLNQIEENVVREMGEENVRKMTDLALGYGKALEEKMSRAQRELEKGDFQNERSGC